MKRTIIIIVFCFMSFTATHVNAAMTTMEIDGLGGLLTGDDITTRQEGKIAILSFSTSMSMSSSHLGGAGAGKPEIGPVTVTKNIDFASPILFKGFFQGKILEVVIRFFRATSDRDPYFTITLQDAKIIQLKTEGNAQLSGGVKESVSFDWGVMKVREEINETEAIFDSTNLKVK